MIEGAFALAFAAGMVATFNPCGFAMLPAYLAYFVGMEDESPDTWTAVVRAMKVSAAVTTGFVQWSRHRPRSARSGLGG